MTDFLTDDTVTVDLPEYGKILCPIPSCTGEVIEQDTGTRWNSIHVEEGTAYIVQEYGDWEGDGFMCSTCNQSVDFTTDIHDVISYG
ncbi:MAG: hypothetical protein ABIQ39_15675 [Ilumatobacteraceae bacterium]